MIYMDGKEIFLKINEFISSTLYKSMLNGLRYYKCKNDIINRKFYYYKLGVKEEDSFRANEKIPNDFLKIIIDQKVHYCVGKDVIIEGVNDLPFDINDEIDHIAEEASQKSKAWCFVWIDKDGNFRQKKVESETIIDIYDGTIEKNLIGLIRTYTQDKFNYAEYWTDFDKSIYVQDGSKYILLETTSHLDNGVSWGKIPFVRMLNNQYEMTDLDNIKDLIDSYDLNLSDFSNNFIDFQDVIYKLKNYSETLRDDTAISDFLDFLKKYKVVNVDENGDFEVLTNEIPSQARIQYLEILRKNIFNMAHAVDTEKLSGGDLTNVTIKAYFTNLDIKANKFIKEIKRYIKDMLYFSNEYKAMNGLPIDDLTKTNIIVNKSQLINEAEIIDSLVASQGMISQETIVKNHPLVDDYEDEIKKINEENSKNEESNNNNFDSNKNESIF